MKMIIYQKVEFDAAHRLLGYDGNCKNFHGHTWVTEIWIEGEELDKCGMLRDYRDIKGYIKAKWDHRAILNCRDPFVTAMEYAHCDYTMLDGNPTAENIANEILRDLKAKKIRIHESKDNYAEVNR